MLDKIKASIENSVGKECFFRFNGSRNQIEEFRGTINGTYSAIFTIAVENFGVRSFSYSDILTKNLEILDLDICKL